MTEKIYRQGAIGAILDEYERALHELKSVLSSVSEEDYVRILDPDTKDPDCRSVQTILRHVIRSGYGYPSYIRPFFGMEVVRPNLRELTKIESMTMLDEMFAYNLATFEDRLTMTEAEMEAIKFTTRWGTDHTLESIMEHAIVHILRHRRQIERLLSI
jgi:uncharacterized damage-inducible protein DinB